MIQRIIGYLLSIVGLAGLALTFEPVKSSVNIALPAAITPIYLTVGSVVLIVIGLFLIWKGNSPNQKSAEVPIYKGKQIIGYRQTK